MTSLSEHGFNETGAVETGQGGLGVIGGIAALAGATTVGAVAGAGGAGMAIGNKIADWTDKSSAGRFGTDDSGHERTAYDAAADTGIGAHKWFDNLVGAKEGSDSAGDTAGNVLGATVAAGAGIGNTVTNAAGHAWDAVSGWI